MIHGYHVIMPMYGFWLPNDPRGSWSEAVRKWELLRYGKSTKGLERRPIHELSPAERQRREAAKKSLRFPPVSIDYRQTAVIADAFAAQSRKSGYTIWACSILPEHTHLVIARHVYKVEQIVNLLKGASTSHLVEAQCHPLAVHTSSDGKLPRMWAAGEWKVFLDSEDAIDNAIRYVEENPVREHLPRQSWPFITPFAGIDRAGWTTYH